MSPRILVIGQGIAGSILAYTLLQRGAHVTVADPLVTPSASDLAAGVINPITGKRYAKSWNFDVFYPFARHFYRELETLANTPIWYEYPIVRMLGSTIEQNEWSLRTGRDDYAGLADVQQHAGAWEGLVQPGWGYGGIHQAARVDFEALRRWLRGQLAAKGYFLQTAIVPTHLDQWLERFDRIVFCEGFSAQFNPYFAHLPWKSVKGEALLIRIPDAYEVASMLKKVITIVPYGTDTFWAGATYEWNFEHTGPTETALQLIQNELAGMLAVDWEVVAHHAAVRPVLQDRRPVMGWSQTAPRIGLFNGLGSKGALLAPYWAAHFADHILLGTPLDQEVDLVR